MWDSQTAGKPLEGALMLGYQLGACAGKVAACCYACATPDKGKTGEARRH